MMKGWEQGKRRGRRKKGKGRGRGGGEREKGRTGREGEKEEMSPNFKKENKIQFLLHNSTSHSFTSKIVP